jgi:DNA repair exonuclease SbcCD nuclease subunit
MKTKLGWFSDTHLDYQQWGYNARRKDFAYAFSHTVDDMLAAGVQGILHTGDLFNSNRPSSESVKAIMPVHSVLVNARVPMYVVPGNHDYTVPSWLELLTPYPGTGIIQLDDGRIAEVGDIRIQGYETMDRDRLVKRFSEDKSEGVHVLMLHQLVKDFLDFPPPGSLEISAIHDKYELVALGDIHVHDLRRRPSGGWIGYPGSTEMCKRDESEHKYWVELDFEDGKLVKLTPHLIKSRPVWRWKVETEDDLAKYLDNVDAAINELRKVDTRAPIVVITFPTSLAGVLSRVRAKLNPDHYVIIEDPVYSRPENSAGQIEVVEDCTVDDVLRQMIPADDRLYSVATQLLNPDVDAKLAVNQFVEDRLKALDAQPG